MNTLKKTQMDTLLLYYIKLCAFLSISRTERDFWTNNHYETQSVQTFWFKKF